MTTEEKQMYRKTYLLRLRHNQRMLMGLLASRDHIPQIAMEEGITQERLTELMKKDMKRMVKKVKKYQRYLKALES